MVKNDDLFTNPMQIAVIAGTPVDTKMGVDFLLGKGAEAKGYPVNASPVEQVAFDVKPVEERMERLQEIIGRILEDKNQKIMVYCNSLSSTLDFAYLQEKNQIPIVTPMDSYRVLAKKFQSLGIMAGSNQALAGIEQVMMRTKVDIGIFGASMLAVVTEIEKGENPDVIIHKFGLNHLLKYFETNKVDAAILGCTHFPYLKTSLETYTKLPIIDPANIIYQLLNKNEE